MTKNNLIVFAAHPDDEVLGCGGTIKKLSKKFNIIVVFFTTGISSRDTSSKKKQIRNLKKDCREANKLLGSNKIIFLDLKDNQLDTYPRIFVIKKIEKILKTYKPQIVFTHHFEDLNIDHQVISNALITACRPNLKNKYLKKILFFEVLSSTEWSVKRNFNPNYYQEINNFISYKLKAMKEYKTEIQQNPLPRSIETIKSLAKLRGSEIGMNYAEAFILFREIE